MTSTTGRSTLQESGSSGKQSSFVQFDHLKRPRCLGTWLKVPCIHAPDSREWPCPVCQCPLVTSHGSSQRLDRRETETGYTGEGYVGRPPGVSCLPACLPACLFCLVCTSRRKPFAPRFGPPISGRRGRGIGSQILTVTYPWSFYACSRLIPCPLLCEKPESRQHPECYRRHLLTVCLRDLDCLSRSHRSRYSPWDSRHLVNAKHERFHRIVRADVDGPSWRAV